MKFQKKIFFSQKNVCFKSLFSNQLPIPGFKHSSPERATVVAIGVVFSTINIIHLLFMKLFFVAMFHK